MPDEFLQKISENEMDSVSRVVYDISSKPLVTMERE
ncbi:MAG: hypothetical protein F4X92_04615 [Gammaproteobacteria bacterium]|nr:hypothetical protein [Gammaproteobacteria bacterium]